ncbi:type II CRISPR RNA-guided endonuclease Cas9 [uncultured Desulfovibrio sp.]|uniref:type II CRISPR RNA-guided endonuclease Cas9 n=1 Tax=uncultured Desulfovibrio sp. TaxID=167968 RepID=UPI00345A24CC
MERLPLQGSERPCLREALDKGAFAVFRGTMRLSLKAMEAILPYLAECGDYAHACELAGFDHRRERAVDINDVRNPVVQHVLREVRRQVAAICHDWNVFPGRVHIELLREVGKSARERRQISKGLDDRARARRKSREELAELFNIPAEQVSGGELLRYELWKAQGEKCAYYMLWRDAGGAARYAGECAEGHIPVAWLRDGSNAAQVDHILPRSRTFDNSFHNLCLCCAAANQAKGGKTPYEWLGRDHPDAWHAFSQWVRATFDKGLKKRNFLLENLDAETQRRFHARNLSDSSYVARLVAAWFREEYERRGASVLRPDGTELRRVFARPGAVTAFLRRQWGVERLKKDAEGQRLEDDRHHAVDALVLACCTEGQLQRITRLFKQGEAEHTEQRIPLPWENFYRDAAAARDGIFVSRALRPTKSGALHEETLRAVRTELGEDGEPVEVIYERKHITALKEEDLDNIKDAVRCPDVVAALRAWLALPQKDRLQEANLPRSAHGDVIRHVRVRSKSQGGVRLRRGDGTAQADNGEMARVDVYTRDGKFYLVPVYLKQLADGVLPVKAIAAHKPEDQWLEMDQNYAFCFSLVKDCYVMIQKSAQEETLGGYYCTTDREGGKIVLSHMIGKSLKNIRSGVQRLARFEKYIVDRLGRLHRVEQEPDPRVRHAAGQGGA